MIDGGGGGGGGTLTYNWAGYRRIRGYSDVCGSKWHNVIKNSLSYHGCMNNS